MNWHIADKMRCEIVAFSGINFSGHRTIVSIHPVGGRQGQELETEQLRSVVIVGDPGTRVVFRTTELEDGWEERPWRAVVIKKGKAYKTKEGKTAVRIPDLDWLDEPNAHRSDPDFQATFDQAATLEGSGEWTFGRAGPPAIKGNVRAIAVDRAG